MLANYSLDEDKIFERILADNWEAKDRSVCMIRAQISKLCKICSERYFPFFRLEKATAKLPKKDLAAVKKRFAFLEVRM